MKSESGSRKAEDMTASISLWQDAAFAGNRKTEKPALQSSNAGLVAGRIKTPTFPVIQVQV